MMIERKDSTRIYVEEIPFLKNFTFCCDIKIEKLKAHHLLEDGYLFYYEKCDCHDAYEWGHEFYLVDRNDNIFLVKCEKSGFPNGENQEDRETVETAIRRNSITDSLKCVIKIDKSEYTNNLTVYLLPEGKSIYDLKKDAELEYEDLCKGLRGRVREKIREALK